MADINQNPPWCWNISLGGGTSFVGAPFSRRHGWCCSRRAHWAALDYSGEPLCGFLGLGEGYRCASKQHSKTRLNM